MNRLQIFFSLVALLFAAGAGEAFDMIKTTSGTTSGNVLSLSPFQVKLQRGSSGPTKEIPVNQIIFVTFDKEPFALKTAKNLIAVEHRYQDGLAALEKVKPEDLSDRPELQEEWEFYRALAEAKLALEGSGAVIDAGKQMLAFVNRHPASYHYLEGCEMVGNLLVANRSFAQAEEYFGKLASAPWPDYRIKAGVAIGWAQLDRGKTDEALKSFESALGVTGGEGPLVQSQRQAAELGKAAVLTAQKKSAEAIDALQTLLQKADPDDGKLMARAYNTLGTAYRQSGQPKEALLAFLTTHLLYPTGSAETHAEALYNLGELWEKVRKPERAAEARKILAERYKNSPWAKKPQT
ncbi:MAG: tetratricopeptide repeat protein [Pirellulales bacterium]|nr:tetratricopeptide repeat protein [Pirellulales bacterium]